MVARGTLTSRFYVKNIVRTNQEVYRKSATGTRSNEKNLHNAKYNRQAVVPMTYSLVNPLDLPRLTDLTICGNQIPEYVTATNMRDSVGDRITRTMKVKKINIVSPNVIILVSFGMVEGDINLHNLAPGSDLRW